MQICFQILLGPSYLLNNSLILREAHIKDLDIDLPLEIAKMDFALGWTFATTPTVSASTPVESSDLGYTRTGGLSGTFAGGGLSAVIFQS